MSEKVIIYGLTDPRTNELRYVGKTTSKMTARLAEHKCHSRRSSTHCATWVRSLAVRGDAPEMFVLESVSVTEWEPAEQFWIAYFRGLGVDLCNHSPGGNGRSDYVPSAQARAKQAAAIRGRKYSAEHRRKIGDAKRGIKRPDVTLRHKLAAEARRVGGVL